MELAGTAVGIISLGLQVCQGIVSYSQAWRGYDEEIQNARNKAKALRMPLKTLRDTVEELQQTRPEVAADLEEQVMSMQSSIEKLKKVVDRFKPAQSDAFPDKFRAQLKKGVYYFQKDTLQDVQNHLDQIQNVLQTSLLIYNWQDTRESRAMQISIYEEMQSMHSILKMAISSTGMPPPSLLQLACDSQHKRSPMMLSDRGPLAQTDLGDDNNRLLCQRQVWIRAQSKRVTRAYTYHNRFLNFAISASFSMIRGAGGFSIAPNLQIQSLWEESSERYNEVLKITREHGQNGLLIPTLLRAFSDQRLSPYDTFYASVFGIVSLMDVIWLNVYGGPLRPSDLQIMLETVKFMLDCGMKPKSTHSYSWMQYPVLFICITATLKMEDLPLILNLIEVTGPLQLNFSDHELAFRSHYVNLKHNLRLVLSQDEELIRATNIAKAIIRESEKELREALASGNSPNDWIGFFSPVGLAFGWPKGIQILLQSGANPHCHFPWCAVAEGEQYHASAALLLEAGCVIEVADFVTNEQCNDGGQRYSLLVDHFAARRRRLCTLAESSLPLDQIPPLDGPPANICGALAAHGIDIPIALRFEADSLGSLAIYQTGLARESRDFTKVMDIMYEIGFHDVDLPDQYGITPLMGFESFILPEPSVIIKCAAWLMSRGAFVERKLPTSNAKVAHLLTTQVVYQCFHKLHYSESFEKNYRNYWKKGIAELGDACFFVSSTKDCCVCACSSGGCTTLSVALRFILLEASECRWIIRNVPLRKLILSLIVWQDYWPELPRAIIRTLTFDALGLTHTCCTEIYQGARLTPTVPKKGRDETEIGRIADDQHSLVEEFEELMEEMESKFDELCLPLEEFLDGYWYDRVIEHLSRRDRYDEKHVTEARKMGIFLEAEEFCIPDRVSLQFRPRLQELQDDSMSDDSMSDDSMSDDSMSDDSMSDDSISDDSISDDSISDERR